MRLTIKSTKLDEVFEFWMPDAGGYVYREYDGRPGTLGDQILRSYDRRSGGHATVRATPDTFERVCRNYVNRLVRAEREVRS